jgi:hypothetical protein
MVFHGLIFSDPLQVVKAIQHFQSMDISSILFFPADFAGLPFYEKFHDRLHHMHPEGRPYLVYMQGPMVSTSPKRFTSNTIRYTVTDQIPAVGFSHLSRSRDAFHGDRDS